MKRLLSPLLLSLLMVAACAAPQSRVPARQPTSVGRAGLCDGWLCGTNGTALTGLTADVGHSVRTVTLASGETISLR